MVLKASLFRRQIFPRSRRASSTTSAAASACPDNLASRPSPATATFTEPGVLQTVRRLKACALQDRSDYVRSSQLQALGFCVCAVIAVTHDDPYLFDWHGIAVLAYRQRPTLSPTPPAPPLPHVTRASHGSQGNSPSSRHPLFLLWWLSLLLWIFYLLAGLRGARGAIPRRTKHTLHPPHSTLHTGEEE